MRTMISDILAQAGFEVVGEAETGSQAVEKYRQLKPDLVTMDIVMPDMGGTDELLQLLFRARDALEQAVELSAVGREDELDVAEVVADLERAAALVAGPERAAPPAPAAPEPPAAAGRLVQVTLRAEAPLKGGRALLVLKRAQALGSVHGVTPPQAALESDDFDGRFSFRLDSPAAW